MAKTLVKDADALAKKGYDAPVTQEDVATVVLDSPAPAHATGEKFVRPARAYAAAWIDARDKLLLEGTPEAPISQDLPVWRVSFAERPDLAPPEEYVRAADALQAWDRYCKVMGIRTTEHKHTVTKVAE